MIECVETCVGDGLGRHHRCAAGEHGKAREALLLLVVEQVVAPVDCRAQRLLTGGRVAGTGAQRTEDDVQALGDLAGRQHAAAGGRQLDRQWEAVDAPADLRHDGGLASARSKPGSWARARSQKSATASTPAQRLRVVGVARSGSASGETGYRCSA